MRDITQMQYLPNYGAALKGGIETGQRIRNQALAEREMETQKQNQAALGQLAPRVMQGDKAALNQMLSLPGGMQAATQVSALKNAQAQQQAAAQDQKMQFMSNLGRAMKEAKDPESVYKQGAQIGISRGMFTPDDFDEYSPGVYKEAMAYADLYGERMTPYQEAQIDIADRRLDIEENQIAEDNIFKDIQKATDQKRQAMIIELADPKTSLERKQQIATMLSPADAAKGYLQKQKGDETSVVGYDIVKGATPSKDDAKKLKAATQAQAVIQDQLGEYRGLVEKHGAEMFGAPAQQMAQRLKIIQLNAKTLEDLGALQAPDIEILEQMLPDATNLTLNPFRAGNVLKQITVYEDYIEDRLKATAETRGYQKKGGLPEGTTRNEDGTYTLPDGRIIRRK